MDIVSIQNKLNAAGYSVGIADGVLGPTTMGAILNFVAGKHLAITAQLGHAMVADFVQYQINTPLRMAHFIAQCCHETGRWQFLTELGNVTYFSKYDGRADLGNNVPGDGFKYRGRGLLQITGKANYGTYGAKMHVDLLGNPDQAAQPEIATMVSCVFWSDHGLNALADADNTLGITKKINGGTNGLAERQAFTTALKGLLGA